jgi:FMN phosphatase YigB (HAD superfamily)
MVYSVGNIDAIVFDLGQVIVEVSHQKSFEAFAKVFEGDRNEIETTFKSIFKSKDHILFELGEITDQEFFSRIKIANLAAHTIEMTKAWNAMIIGVSLENVSLLKTLKQKVSLFALSNTNTTHVQAINSFLLEKYNIKDIRQLFTKIYYSYELNLRKPNEKIFEYIIKDIGLDPQRMLFIDDELDNVQAATGLGFQTIYLHEPGQLLGELKKFGFFSNTIKFD